MNKAREVFELIDKDDSGSLAIDEITTAVKSDKVVKDFLKTCGDETLMFLLQPKRLDHALRELDTDGSGEVDIDEWEEAIRRGLSKRLEQLADERERRERAAAAEDEAFSAEFLFAARKVFMMARGRRRQLPSKPSRHRARERRVTHGSFTHRSTKMTRARSQRKR